MTQEDPLDHELRALRESAIPEGPPAEIVSRTLAALHEKSFQAPSFSLLERIRMMPPILRLAAAVLVAATATGMVSIATSGRRGPNAAFAEVVENVRAARTVTYTMRIGDDARPFRISRMEPGRIRTELPGGSITIMDRVHGKTLTLFPERKEATLFESAARPAGPAEDEIDALRRFRGKPDAELGEKLIDGRKARGFRFSEGGWHRVVWVDGQTDLPVRMESETALNAETLKTIVLSDFVFDRPLDEALFSMTPPAGYTTRSVSLAPVDQTPPTEKDLIDLLGEYARRSGGRFPNDLQPPSLLDVVKDVKVDGGFDAATSAWIAKIGKGIGLIWAMPPASEPRYTGKGIKLGEADRPIFRYIPQGSKTFRVIFGDLSVKDVEPDRIAR